MLLASFREEVRVTPAPSGVNAEELKKPASLFTVTETRTRVTVVEDEEEERRWFFKDWMRNFGQNAFFVVVVVPLAAALVLEALLSLLTCCLLCRALPPGAPPAYRLPYNLAFLAVVCGKFASGDSATLPRACEGAGSSGSACADEELEQQIVMFTVEARPEQEQREQRPAKRWAGAFSQNLVFLVAALPVLLLVLIDALFSAVTLCLLCRSPPRQGPQHFRLLFNFAFFQSACGGLPPPPPPARGRARSPAK